MVNEPLLKVKDVGIQFGGLKAVSNFNMEINQGELIGLIGPNGAGKTTSFNLLTGVYTPTEGDILLMESVLMEWLLIKLPEEESVVPSKISVCSMNYPFWTM